MTDGLTMEALPSPLLEYHAELEAIRSAGDILLAGVTEIQFLWKPSPERWSVADCFMHLNITGTRYLEKIDQTIAGARKRNLLGTGPYRSGFLGGWLIRKMEPPPTRKVRAPRTFTPTTPLPLNEVRQTFDALQRQFQDRLRLANGLHLTRARVTSPVSALFRIGLGDAFGFLAAHERRHMWQAEQVRTSEGFPQQ